MRKPVATKEELLDLMFELMDEADAIEWPSDTPYAFVQHMAGWLDQSTGDDCRPTWDLFAKILGAGRGFDGDDQTASPLP